MSCNCEHEKGKKPTTTPSVIEINNPEQLVLLRRVVVPTSLGDDTTVPPAIGKYRNVVLVYEANKHVYLYSSDGIPTAIEVPTEVYARLTALETGLANETEARERADSALHQEIVDLKNSPDVVDIVPTYAALQQYDTSALGDKDIIRVLADETHDGQSTYYRWTLASGTWTYIGAVGDYYTKAQTDTLLNGKQNTLTFDQTPTSDSSNPVTSAGIKSYVDTKSVAFKPFPSSVATTGTTEQFMDSILALHPEVGMAYLGTVSLSDMPAGLLQEEVEVYVYSDYVVYCVMRSTDVAPYAWWCASYNYQGWQPTNTDTAYTAGENISISAQNIISATNTGKAKVLTANDYNYPTSDPTNIALWLLPDGLYSVQSTDIRNKIKVAKSATQSNWLQMLVGKGNYLVHHADDGRVTIHFFGLSGGTDSYGYFIHRTAVVDQNEKITNVPDIALVSSQIVDRLNSDNPRSVLSANQGKILNEKIEGLAISGSGAPTTSTKGTVGKLYEDTTNGKLYQCTAIADVSGTTQYTWSEIGAGGGGASYTAGDGIDITSNVISATNTGRVRELTAADYNYPTTGTKDRVALWLLEAGIYRVGSGVVVGMNVSSNDNTGGTYIIGKDASNRRQILRLRGNSLTGVRYDVTSSSGATLVADVAVFSKVIDTLTSTSATDSLSARQGKVLKGLIDGTVLYDNASGADTGIVLSDSVNNYTYIDIFYQDYNLFQGYTRCLGGSAFTTALTVWHGSNQGSSATSSVGAMTAIYSVSGTTINYLEDISQGGASNTYASVTISGGTAGTTMTNGIKIVKVIGYK